ncbi:MAG: hypothetical protein OXG05_10225 [Gammaproteobacteria bacterium]|nr:hypothetical protein [Gammaproteobacteria bacterium]
MRDAPLHLLEHRAFLGEDTIESMPSINPLSTDMRMRKFVVPEIIEVKSRRFRVHSLMNKLAEHGYYSDYYDAGLTLTAHQAFALQRGNCLSYTHMFIALAREAGLDARYELVRAPPLYSVTDGVLEHQVHIRSRVMWPTDYNSTNADGIWRLPTGVARTLSAPRINLERHISVDFNERNIRAFDGQIVSDDFARALHLANNAVEYWKHGDESKAFTYIVQAIRLAPRYADHWVNLATFYSRRGLSEEALLINRYALSLNPHHIIALSGVVQHAGSSELSRAKSRLQRLRDNNPHYQYALAQRASANDDLLGALQFIERSLALEKRNHEFLAYKATILTSLERYPEALETINRAISHVMNQREREEYEDTSRVIERAIVENQPNENTLSELHAKVTKQQTP